MSHRALPLVVLAALAGCTYWAKDDTALLAPIPERKPVQIFTPDGAVIAHSVRVDSTTLSYIRRIVPSECDSCRVAIPLATVDSVRTSQVSTLRTIVLVVPLAVFTYLSLAWSGEDMANY